MRLIDAPVGLFLYKGEMCLKTEYIADWGIEAYIVSSGEIFWGGAKTAEERNNLDVTPIEAEPVRYGRWNADGSCSDVESSIIKTPMAQTTATTAERRWIWRRNTMSLTNIEQNVKGGEESICKTCAHNIVCRYKDNQPCIECNQYARQKRHGRKGKSIISGTGLMCTACYSDIDADAVFCKYCRAKMDGDSHDQA